MQQYNTTATFSSRTTQGVQSQVSDNSQRQSNIAPSNNHSSEDLPTDLSSLYESPKTVKNLSTATTSEADSKSTTVDPTSKPHASTSTEPSEDLSEICTSEEELRKRRLQKFQLQNEH